MLVGFVFLIAWALLTLPWVGPETREFLSYRVFDPAGLVLPMIAAVLAARAATSRPEKTFWWLVSAAFTAWFLAPLPRLPGIEAAESTITALWADFGYVGYYMLMFLAADLRPGTIHEEGRRGRIRPETAGLLVLLAAAVVYTVLLPSSVAPDVYTSRMPSFLLYLVFDLLLLVQFAILTRDAATPEWRRVLGLITATAAGFVFFDGLQGLGLVGAIPLPGFGTPLDAAWQAPILPILAAARLRVVQGPVSATAAVPRSEDADSFPGRLILFASVLPVVHLFIYGIGFAAPDLQKARIFIVLVTMLLLQALAFLESRRLLRRNRRLRREHLQAAARVQQAHHWETVGRLAGGIAHEFNNIMTAILGHAGLLREHVQHHPQARADLKVIESSGARAAELTRQMLAFGHREEVYPEPTDLNAVIRELCATRFTQALRGEVELRTDLAHDLPPVHGDRRGLIAALTEIASNAGDAMPDGGIFAVSTGLERSGRKDDWHAVLVVLRDSGEGMAAEIQSRVFDPFFTTKDVGKGTGLGLSSALGTIEQMGGTIEIHSAPGEGTEVKVRLRTA